MLGAKKSRVSSGFNDTAPAVYDDTFEMEYRVVKRQTIAIRMAQIAEKLLNPFSVRSKSKSSLLLQEFC
jgi:hypothetical protein